MNLFSTALPKKCYLNFNHPTMKSIFGSVSLHFEAPYSNVLIFHINCDSAEQPILIDVTLSVSS